MTEDHLCATVSVRGVLTDPHGQLLIVRRSSDRQWELPGGRLAPDEPPVCGLKRELTEETGLTTTVETILCADSWINDQSQDRFAIYYTCTCEMTEEQVTLSQEHIDFQWVLPSTAETLLCKKHMAAVRASVDSDSNLELDQSVDADVEMSSPTTQSSVSHE
jgi:ADP-ribose pyrophosphatase